MNVNYHSLDQLYLNKAKQIINLPSIFSTFVVDRSVSMEHGDKETSDWKLSLKSEN